MVGLPNPTQVAHLSITFHHSTLWGWQAAHPIDHWATLLAVIRLTVEQGTLQFGKCMASLPLAFSDTLISGM